MRLITGGAFQGKVRYAQEKYGISDAETADASLATGQELEQAALVCHLQEYIRRHHQGDQCSLPRFREDAVIICDEVGCGVIPLSREERAFREATGRICCQLAEKAESVELVRCGIVRRLK